jgi:phthiodiolone/phenolphthiodiolone dimycocerosates ketoreductase
MLKIGVVGPTFPPIEGIKRVAKRIEEKGYDSIWFPDHLMGWFPQTIWTPDIVGPLAIYSPHTFFETTISIVLAASATSKLRIGSAVTEAVRHHPAMLAQSYATLEHATKSRVILGLGAGELENIEPYGLKYEKVVSRLEEAIRVIKILWGAKRDENLNYDGKFFKLKDAVFELPPLNRRPPIWIGGSGVRMCRITAKYAEGWLPTGLTPEEYKERLDVIRDECIARNRNYNGIEKGVFLNVIIDESTDECIRLMKESVAIKTGALLAPASIYKKAGYKHPLGEKFYALTDYVPSRYSKDKILGALEKIPLEVVKECFIWGNVEEVIDKLDMYRKAGAQTVVLWNLTFLGDASKIKSSYACIDKVVEYFKEKDGTYGLKLLEG